MSSLVVKTKCGSLRGAKEANGVVVFRGVRYAQSTADTNRFRPPAPLAPWLGKQDAIEFGPIAPQPAAATIRIAPALAEIFGLNNGEPASSEDCLRLNVWTPSIEHGPLRPVMVWLHGGGFTTGFGSAAGRSATNGDRLAAENDVVVVTLNHRLGCLGFLDLSSLDERLPSSGNLGMLDIIAALTWIRENIAAFGGDPTSVTLFGESGGAIKANILMAMPAADGLFHRAILQSGAGAAGRYAFGLKAFEPSTAAAFTYKFCRELGMSAPDLSRLCNLSTETLMAAQASMIAKEGVVGGPVGFMPVAETDDLPQHPIEPGACRDLPIIIGTTSQEIATMLASQAWFGSLHAADIAGVLEPVIGNRVHSLLPAYQLVYQGASPTRLAIQVLSDIWRLMAQKIADQKVAAGGLVYAYEFTYETEVLGGTLGANHGLDISFAFDTPDRVQITGADPARHTVSRWMSAAWANFARSGHPTAPGLPEWLPYDRRRKVMALGRRPEMIDLLPQPIRRAWEAVEPWI